jgi:tRNA (guanine-N7-)-methyltransferase
MQPISGRGKRRKPRDPAGHGLVPDALPRPATALALFGNDRPLELEIGSGKGTFLLAESGARPDVNFLGIEYARRYWIFAADRLRRGERANARVVLAEASAFLREFVPDESFSAVHVYFPDPWPKTRHHRRRLVNPAFLHLVASKLKPGARLSIATDHRDYFDRIAAAIREAPLARVDFRRTSAALEEESVGSNFERKYRREGRMLYMIAATKPPVPSLTEVQKTREERKVAKKD